MGRQQHRCHGDAERFGVMADFVFERFGKSVRHIADVAGGQGLLAQQLIKKYGYDAEVIDPRGFTIKGVSSRAVPYTPDMADYYDLIVGLHPDEATRAVVESVRARPVIVVPCCNFWAPEKLGRDALVDAICAFLRSDGRPHEKITFGFDGPKNIGVVAYPK